MSFVILNGHEMAFEPVTVEVAWTWLQDYNFRKTFKGSEQDSQLAFLLKSGQTSPLLVSEREDGSRVLLCGHRRIAAVADGYVFVVCVVKGLTPDQEFDIVTSDNSGRKRFTAGDYVLAIRGYAALGHTIDQMAALLGMSKASIKTFKASTAWPSVMLVELNDAGSKFTHGHGMVLFPARQWCPDLDWASWIARVKAEGLSVEGLKDVLKKEFSAQKSAWQQKKFEEAQVKLRERHQNLLNKAKDVQTRIVAPVPADKTAEPVGAPEPVAEAPTPVVVPEPLQDAA